MSAHKDIAIPPTIASMVDARERAVLALRKVYDAIEHAQAECAHIARHAFPAEVAGRLSLPEAIKEVDRRAWREAFTLGGFDRIWDAEARRKFNDSLSYSVPEFNDANLRATLLEYLPQQDLMFKRGAVTLLRRLSGNYKSNADSGFKLGPRSVVGGWSAPSFGRGFQVSYYRQDEVRDLLRIVAVLSGLEFHPGEALAAVNRAWAEKQPYEAFGLRLVAFRNQNVHVYLDQTLLDRINTLIADYYGDRAVGEAA
ncbi:MAG: hypothetical protein C0434_07950 [Xanthomonadaceae bacterium]|nr:hypothetical protein [Xanthomonadaceae bacterium]